MKAKTYQVSINGETFLVEAQTIAGARRDVVAHLSEKLAAAAIIDLATGEQLYRAGRNGTPILNNGRYAVAHDPNQLPLAGVPETASNINQSDEE